MYEYRYFHHRCHCFQPQGKIREWGCCCLLPPYLWQFVLLSPSAFVDTVKCHSITSLLKPNWIYYNAVSNVQLWLIVCRLSALRISSPLPQKSFPHRRWGWWVGFCYPQRTNTACLLSAFDLALTKNLLPFKAADMRELIGRCVPPGTPTHKSGLCLCLAAKWDSF